MIGGIGQAVRGLVGAEEVLRLGVTGLSRAGKTVFITALVANLLDRVRMAGLRAEAAGRIRAVYLQPQPDDTVPRFDFEAHLAALTGSAPHWPESTRAVSELRLSFRLQGRGLMGAVLGERLLHLDIVDYPGEWLLDLMLMDQSYEDWSRGAFEKLAARAEELPGARACLEAMVGVDAGARLEEGEATRLAGLFTDYLKAARAAGYADCTPGRFLLPGDLAGSPALTFAPLKIDLHPGRGSVGREFARRFEAYKAKVVTPFFRDHFAKIDRQVVLTDLLAALDAGPRAVEDLRTTMASVLQAFRPGRRGWLASLLGQRRVERILFAATKADHLHSSQHARLAAILAALMRAAKERADFAGAGTAAMAIAALRVTAEDMVRSGGREVACVKGRLEDGRVAAFHAGDLPDNPAEILTRAREAAAGWLDGDYQAMRFLPAAGGGAGRGLPHIRLDRAVDFLIGDRL